VANLPTAEERRARGRAAREHAPRRAHGDWAAPPGRADPVGLLERQAADAVPELLPLRYGLMGASPFAFFRGAAAIMTADLAGTPRSGFVAQLCGDAHLANFGGFASPDRELVFDLNDFDETLPGPWEWDLKRLAASVEVAGRDRELSRKERRAAVAGAAEAYRKAMRRFAKRRSLEVWYARLEADEIVERLRGAFDKDAVREVERELEKARRKDSLRALDELTERADGALRIISDPPVVVRISDLMPDVDAGALEAAIQEILRAYRESLRHDLHPLVESYRFVDLARKVVGVGSVGARAWIALLAGRDEDDPLFLQVKEARPSVLQPHLGRSRYANQGRRVVEGQRRMQAASDLLLGWVRADAGDGVTRDFYVRQLWDWKLSPRIEAMTARGLAAYAQLCAWTLARAHARTGDRIAIAAYLGRGEAFEGALVRFAEAYADQNERDHAALAEAIRSGRVPADTGA
jgi:uncharacterized protein (DUF2252 family)